MDAYVYPPFDVSALTNYSASLYLQVLNPQANEVLYGGTVALVRWIMAVRHEKTHSSGTSDYVIDMDSTRRTYCLDAPGGPHHCGHHSIGRYSHCSKCAGDPWILVLDRETPTRQGLHYHGAWQGGAVILRPNCLTIDSLTGVLCSHAKPVRYYARHAVTLYTFALYVSRPTECT